MAYILYHGDCYDGFGAAWAIRKGLARDTAFLTEERQDVYIPCFYGQPMPEIPDGQQVILADFCYPKAELEALAERSYFVTVIDHHKTAKDDLESLQPCPPNLEVIFDMEKSGAVLAWEEFMDFGVPLFLKYIEDRDLWRKALEYHEEVTAWIQSYPRTFDTYDMLNSLLGTEFDLDWIEGEGSAILRYKTQKVAEIAKHVRLQSLGGYDKIPVVNCPYNFSSDTVHALLQQYPDAPFAAYWFVRGDGVTQWGLRSRKDFDCSVVAKKFGGGGHPQAAGFELQSEV